MISGDATDHALEMHNPAVERLERQVVKLAEHCPVLMLHGAEDPHPGALIRDSLWPHLPHLEYHEWARCGHYPWLERCVRVEFFALLERWLRAHCGPPSAARSGH